jgi:hypothetical protein
MIQSGSLERLKLVRGHKPLNNDGANTTTTTTQTLITINYEWINKSRKRKEQKP